ncbi:MAG: RHS repeat-associated core domain-containing protein [Sulfolobaceae archaeon]
MAEKDGSGRIQKVYINDGEGIIGMVRYIYNNNGTFSHYQRMYYLYDSLGSVSVVISENGMPLQEYYYTPYGSTSNVEYDSVNNLRFIGRYSGYKDDDTGLTYFWHRWYDERDGRWVSRDPVGVCGGINLYGYVNNRPNYFIDQTGLITLCDIIRILQSLVPTHGNYGGPGWTGGKRPECGEEPDFSKPPQDPLDYCYKIHDKCYYDKCIKQYLCDIELLGCLSSIGGGFYGISSGVAFSFILPVKVIINF